MASVIVSIPSTDRTVTRPVSITILRQLLKICRLNPDDFRTKMVGVADAEKIQGGYLKDTTNEEDTDDTPIANEDKIDIKANRLSTDKKLTLEVEDEIVGDLTTPVRYNDHKPIFVDEALNVRIRPVYSDMQTRISVVLNTRDKVEANNWLQSVKARLYRSALTHGHSVDYSYIIPHSIMKSIYDIHQRREFIAGYGETFGQYIEKCFDNRYDILTNVSGTNHICVIKEKQVNVLGWFDFDFEPEKPEREDDKAGGWNIKFTYTIRYQRPDNLVFDYPLMVHQSLVPDSMIIKERPEHQSTYPVFRGLTAGYYHLLATFGNKHGMMVAEGIPEPTYDDWIPNWSPGKYVQLARIMLQVDPDDQNWVVDIPDLAESFEYKPNMLRWFRQRGHRILEHRWDPFYFTVHEDNKKMEDNNLSITSDLKITSNEPLNLRNMYHVVAWVMYDLSELHPDAWRELLKNCDILHEWLLAIAPGTGVEEIRCNLDNTVNIDDFKKWWDKNGSIFGNLPNGPGLPWSDCLGTFCKTKAGWDTNGLGPDWDKWAKRADHKTVGHFGIIAKRMRNNNEGWEG